MSNLTYIKSVRTRFRNSLEKEISIAEQLTSEAFQEYITDCEKQITSCNICIEKICGNKEKVQSQSEKMCLSLSESDDELLTKVVNDDADLCDIAVERCVQLRRRIEMLTALKDQIVQKSMKQDVHESPLMAELVQLRKDMQDIILLQSKVEIKQENKQQNMQTVKLPKLELLSFNGDKTKWYEFWGSFESSVHTNSQLSDVDKFNYLKGKVNGAAREAISGLALTKENYAVAVGILKERFGNVQEVVKMHYDRLISLPPASSKVSSLRQLVDTVNQHLRSLKVLGQNENQEIFVSVLWSKIPDDVLLQLQLNNGVTERWSVTNLIERLNDYVVARERVEKKTMPEKK